MYNTQRDTHAQRPHSDMIYLCPYKYALFQKISCFVRFTFWECIAPRVYTVHIHVVWIFMLKNGLDNIKQFYFKQYIIFIYVKGMNVARFMTDLPSMDRQTWINLLYCVWTLRKQGTFYITANHRVTGKPQLHNEVHTYINLIYVSHS